MKYYYLISGFPDIQLDDTQDVPSMETLKAMLEEQLAKSDMRLLNLIYAQYDNKNLLKYLKNKEAELDSLGVLKANDWEDLTNLMDEEDEYYNKVKDKRLTPYVKQFYNSYRDEKFSFETVSEEDYLSALYYEYAMQAKNKFLHDWFEFNLNVNNLLTAIACRKYGFEVQKYIVGDNEVAEILRKSNARDFGLTGVLDGFEEVMRISEEPNLLTREKMIDELKWSWLDEHTFFEYFTIERVLSFVLKCQLINRWEPLTQEKGTEVFRRLINTLKEEVKFEE